MTKLESADVIIKYGGECDCCDELECIYCCNAGECGGREYSDRVENAIKYKKEHGNDRI